MENNSKVEKIICKPFEILLKNRRTPILFLGSGFSLRYLEDYPNWETLLISMAKYIGFTETNLKLILNENKKNHPRGKACQITASFINEKLKELIMTGNIEKFISKDDLEKIANNNLVPLKYLIAKRFETEFLINRKSYYKNELVLFKQLREKIPVILTTNYDCFIEYLFENEFKVYVNQSDYFYDDNVNFAELYKIHGSIKSPNSLVVTDEDYKEFFNKAYLTSAKIMTLLSEHPIIFIGYSLSDENMQMLIDNLLSCLTNKQIEELVQSIIFINRKEGFRFMASGFKEIKLPTRSFNVTVVETDNFLRLYEYLNMFEPQATPAQIRKNQLLIKKLIQTNDKKLRPLLVAAENLDDSVSNNKVAVAFGGALKAARKYTIEDLTLDVLFEKNYDALEILNDWTAKNFSINTYVPLFYYLNKIDKSKIINTEKINNFIKDKKYQFNLIKFDGYDLCATENQLQKALKKYESFDQIKFLMYNYKENRISEAQFRKYLQDLYNKDNSILSMRDFRIAVTAIDFYK